MIFRYFILLLSIVLLNGSCVSPSSKKAPPPKIKTKKVEVRHSPLLWEIKRDNFPTSYILGTIHLGVAASELDPVIWKYFKISKQIVLEADILSADPRKIKKSILLPRFKKLQSMLTKEEWLTLIARLPNIPPKVLNRMNPYGVLNQLQRDSLPNHKSMDQVFHEKAKEQHKSTIFLESIDFQLNLLKSLFTIQDLKHGLKFKFEPKKEVEKFRKLYLGGNSQKIYDAIVNPSTKQIKMNPKNISKLLDNRNRNWSTILEPILRRESTFIAVGAGHLAGKNGVLMLLNNRGFKTTRYTHEKP